MEENRHKINNIFSKLNAPIILSAILKQYKTISVPANSFDDLLNKVQMWPNDYLTQNDGEGHVMMFYNKNNKTIEFELARSGEGIKKDGLLGYTCIRNVSFPPGKPNIDYVNYNSVMYKD